MITRSTLAVALPQYKAAKRLVAQTTLYSGSHKATPPTDFSAPCKECVMELSAHIELLCNFAGATWTDEPTSVCPVIRSFCIGLNDNFDDDMRQLLKPYALKVIGTRADKVTEQRRMFLCADFAVRTLAPIALRAAGYKTEATKLAKLPPIIDKESALAAENAAYAANVAANAAYAVANAAYAAAYAANAAANAANAAYAAANAVRGQSGAKVLKKCLRFIDTLIAA